MLNRRPDCDRAARRARRVVQGAGQAGRPRTSPGARNRSRSGFKHALVRGQTYIDEDTEEARQKFARPSHHRRPADGRHERRRRPLRAGQDVPAAGREERARDETGGGLSRAFHRGGEGEIRRRRQAQGHDRAGDRQGRRPRHRQEHRRRRAPVQQFRGDRSRRDGAGYEDPRHGARAQRRHRRPVGAHHAVARGNGARRARDAASRHDAAAPHRRRHHVARAHGGEDRAELCRSHRLRAGRVARGGRGEQPPVRRAQDRLCGRGRRRLRKGPRAACGQEGPDAGLARRRPRQCLSCRLGALFAPGADGAGPPRVPQRRSRRNREMHRLGSLLPGVGAERSVPGPSRRSRRRRSGAQRVCRRAGDAAGHRCRPLAHRQRRHGDPAGEIPPATTSRCTPTSRARRWC